MIIDTSRIDLTKLGSLISVDPLCRSINLKKVIIGKLVGSELLPLDLSSVTKLLDCGTKLIEALLYLGADPVYKKEFTIKVIKHQNPPTDELIERMAIVMISFLVSDVSSANSVKAIPQFLKSCSYPDIAENFNQISDIVDIRDFLVKYVKDNSELILDQFGQSIKSRFALGLAGHRLLNDLAEEAEKLDDESKTMILSYKKNKPWITLHPAICTFSHRLTINQYCLAKLDNIGSLRIKDYQKSFNKKILSYTPKEEHEILDKLNSIFQPLN